MPIFPQENTGEQIIIPLSLPGEPGVLTIDHIKGSIKVTGYDGDAVIINASIRQKEGKEPDDEYDGDLKRIAPIIIQLSAQEKNNEIIVNTNSHKNTIDLNISVPHIFTLKLKTYHNGDIVVRNVTGEMEISNINGDVILKDINGSAVVNTLDGDITIQFSEIFPDLPMAFTSIEGKIDVTFPQNVKVLVKMKSDNGEIFSDFNFEMVKRETNVDKSNQTGLFKVSLEDWVRGKINGGGPELLFKTLEGNIYIRKQK